MKRITRLCTLLITMLLTSSAFAQFEHGNGGGGFRCQNGSVQILDYVANAQGQSGKLDIQLPQADTWQAKALLTIQRIAMVNPSRANLYQNWLASFINETRFTDGTLPTRDDVGVLAIPDGCQFVQIALQQEPALPTDARYTIDQNLWKQMDDDQKAGLVLHELAWRDVRLQTHPHQDSRFIRYFVAQISSPSIEKFTLEDYLNFLQLVRFENAEIQFGIQLDMPACWQVPCSPQVEFWPSNNVKSANVIDQKIPMPTAWLGGSVQMDAESAFLQKGKLQFLENGEPARFYLNSSKTYSARVKLFNEKTGLKVEAVTSDVPGALQISQAVINGHLVVSLESASLMGNNSLLVPRFTAKATMAKKSMLCEEQIVIDVTSGKVESCDSVVP